MGNALTIFFTIFRRIRKLLVFCYRRVVDNKRHFRILKLVHFSECQVQRAVLSLNIVKELETNQI